MPMEIQARHYLFLGDIILDRVNRTADAFAGAVPVWLPRAAMNYLRHIEGGVAIRALARAQGCHASTVLRQVRRIERRRDEFLIDEALKDLGASLAKSDVQEKTPMTANFDANCKLPDELTVEREGRRVLRRLAEPGAVLAVARDMEKAVVVRETKDGRTIRTGVVDRAIAQAMALKDWISCKTEGKISRYKITQAGRGAMQRLMAADPNENKGFAEAAASFGDQHRDWGEKDVMEDGESRPRRIRYNVAESPIASLARRRDKDGNPFLSDDLVTAGERLREDFEMAQMGPRVAQNWERFLTGSDKGSMDGGAGPASGPDAARNRVSAALRDIGPGLGDVVLRCCCFLEGMETAEKRMGWSARSGKIVLRIALQQLKRHYDKQGFNQLIG